MHAGTVTTSEPDGTGLSAAPLGLRTVVAGRERWSVEDASEVLFVVAGEGTLRVAGEEHRLGPNTGAFLGPGESAEIVGDDGDLRLVIARTPPGELVGARVVRYTEQAHESAGTTRSFRVLVRSSAATQFVGLIKPGRANMHNHSYDEVAYLLDGDGLLHWEDGTSVPVAAGSCIHFPRLVFHSLENLGGAEMRIMGVFHPAGSPANRVAVLDY